MVNAEPSSAGKAPVSCEELIVLFVKVCVPSLVVMFDDSLASGKVPEATLVAFKLVRAEPLTAGKVAGNLPSGKVPVVKALASSLAGTLSNAPDLTSPLASNKSDMFLVLLILQKSP